MFINKKYSYLSQQRWLNIAIGDWILARSDSFKDLLANLRDHKINTKNSFGRVKDKHRDYEAKLREQDARIRELEGIISSIQMVGEIPVPTPRFKKANKKNKRKR
ncbi:MAG: hypothetical protein Q8Q42_00445 [Nanoarchaeota archaeon]|nr:hypothetical protein [Nanoarchaeota archaeon]